MRPINEHLLKRLFIAVGFGTAILSSTRIVSGQVRSGGFGNFFIGGVYNFCPSLQDNLHSDELLGSGVKTNVATVIFGGSGYAVRPKGVVIGGSGIVYNITSTTARGSAKLGIAGGFFNVGYVVMHTEGMIGYPYFGMGGLGATVKITNRTSDKILLFGSDKIAQGSSSAYSSGGLTFEMGFSLKFVIDKFSKPTDSSSRVGLILGIDAGAGIFPGMTKWENAASEREITEYSEPFILSPYIRASIGMSILGP